MIVKAGNERLLCDRDGNRLHDLSHFSKLGTQYSEGLCSASNGGLCGFIDTNGQPATEFSFTDADNFLEGVARVRIEREHWLVNRGGSRRNGPFESLGSSIGGVATGRLNDAPGFLSVSTGQWQAVPFAYYVSSIRHANMLAFSDGVRFGVIDRLGKVLFEPRFESIGWFCDGLCPVKDGKKWGMVNERFDWVVEPTFDHMSKYRNGLAIADRGNSSVAIDGSGSEIWCTDLAVYGPPSCGLMPCTTFR
jgi:hypothetical protein